MMDFEYPFFISQKGKKQAERKVQIFWSILLPQLGSIEIKDFVYV